MRRSAVQQRSLRRVHPHSGANRRKNMYAIPEHVSYQDAALVEPLACVMRGLEETGVASRRYRGGHRSGPHRNDVRALAKAVYRRA